MNTIYVIALNTFRETLRDKVLYNALVFALLLIACALVLGALTIGEQGKIIKDIGLASIDLFGAIIAIFVGIGLVNKEIERRTIYTIISKPVHRYKFLLGRYAGLVLALWGNTLLMAIAFSLVMVVSQVGIDGGLIKAIVLICLGQLIVLSSAVLFSTFTTTTLSAIFTLSFYVIGRLSTDLQAIGEKLPDGVAKSLLSVLHQILPNLTVFNMKGEAVHAIPIDLGYMLNAACYGVAYASIMMLLASVIFQRRDF